MALCTFFSALADDAKSAIRSAKDSIDEMMKKKNFNREQLKETECGLSSALNRLLIAVAYTPPHIIFAVEALIEFASQGFGNVTCEINEKKLKELSDELEILFQMVVDALQGKNMEGKSCFHSVCCIRK